MNPLEGIGQYLDRLERRLRLITWTRGAAAIAGAALVLTLAIVAALMAAAFSPSSLVLGRFALFLGIGAAVAIALIVPLLRMNRSRVAQEGEHKHPGFDQRLLTFTEKARDNASDPFLPLLAADALEVARGAEPEQVIGNGRIIQFASLAAAAASVLLWLMFWGPGVLGTGTALLWGSYPKDQVKLIYSIDVQPGSKTIRRKSDQVITAQLNGFTSSKASVWVRYVSGSKWEEGPMQPQSGGPGFSFPLVGVPEDAEYYVEAAGVKSNTYRIHVVDLPAVKNLRVTYNYPAWTGLKAEVEDPGGDLRAVEGTVAKVEIQTDRPLANAQVLFDDGKPIDLEPTQDNRTTANIAIAKDGTYHIGVMDHGEMIRLTDDYFIEARKVSPPNVKITKPGHDAKVSPIEEVDVQVSGEDEYPLQELDLHYSVNGGPEKTVSLLKQKGAKKVDAGTLLAMEDYKLVPGDIVSMYATARDGKNSSKTDMLFIQAVPFEFNYTQSQQQGGGGGMQMDQEQQISEREKEIIAATFNQVRGDAKAKAGAAENAKYLADVQAKLRDQAQSMANRTKARQLDANGAAFQQFVKEMEAAVAAMTPASEKLKSQSFQDALTPEQQALQHLLRAESTFRDIQIQMSRGGGGGGGGGGAGRDLANLFDLELDKEKNQYETNASSQSEQQQQKIDDAMKKLAELARRQQELAQQQQNNPQQLAQQRWQQEMLRREAEQLRREMEQMQRGDQQGQQGQQSGQQSASSQSNGQSGQQSGQQGQQSGQQSRGQQSGQQMARNNQMSRGQQQQLDQAIRQLEQATRDMSNSASARQNGQQGQQGSAQSEAQRAAERLKQAQQMMQAMANARNGSEMSDIANKAERLADQQQDFEQRLRRNFSGGQDNQQTAQQMADEKRQMHNAYDQLQKEMQSASRGLAGAQPDLAKKLRDAMGKSQQDEVGNRMDFTEQALRQGLGQYAVMREAPVTRSLNELKDEMKKLEGAAGQSPSDDKGKIATQQALDQAERVRKEIEQLSRAAQASRQGRNGNQQGNQPGGQQRAGNQNGQGQRQQQGQGQQQAHNGQQQGQGQQGGQQPGGQQPGGQQGGNGQQGGAQQAGNSPQGSSGNQGGGGGVNNAGGPRNGQASGGLGWNEGQLNGPGWRGDTRRLDAPYAGDLQTGPV
ncbi:MAG TPA: hypothetical protein VHB50_12870, partial [Bryobacteraceae bacterium]|nr:hypothetical protein [Bryobacteraceae bacterium]